MFRRTTLLPLFITGLLASAQFTASAASPEKVVTINEANFAKLDPNDQQRVLYIKDRLETITAMDRSSLTKDERRALRTEVKGLRSEANEFNKHGSVVYISTAGLIIIILLLIILL